MDHTYSLVNIVWKHYYILTVKGASMDSRVIAKLILHLGRIASCEGLVEGLTPGQSSALGYFARANRFSRTPSAFATFHGTTRGTASQTIKSLVAGGYLTPSRSETDGRGVQLELTDKARVVMPKDPLAALVRAADALPPGVRGHFSKTLERILSNVALEIGKPPFGMCETCAHLESNACCEDGMARYACGFVNEPLVEEELDELCINFTPGKSLPPRSSGVGAA